MTDRPVTDRRPATARLAALETEIAALRTDMADLHKLVAKLADDVAETIRVTGCMDPRNRPLDDWLRQFATLYQSDSARAERQAQASMLHWWQATVAVQEGRAKRWQVIALGLGVLSSAFFVLQFVGSHAITAIRAITGGAP